jgi:selenocysteine lyase/cysteine desulfurase
VSADGPADYAADFGNFDGRTWLNAAHQGPLPRVGVAAAEQALREKTAPHLIEDAAFVELPRRLRELLGRLINAPAEEVILGNSASWGLQVLANGLPWREGDEILVLADEFPATVFPWLVVEEEGARVRRLELDTPVLEPERLASELAPRTRVVAVNWVRSLTGYTVDLGGLHEVCERQASTWSSMRPKGSARCPSTSLPYRSRRSAAPDSSGCSARTPPASRGSVPTCSRRCARFRRTGWRCRMALRST